MQTERPERLHEQFIRLSSTIRDILENRPPEGMVQKTPKALRCKRNNDSVGDVALLRRQVLELLVEHERIRSHCF